MALGITLITFIATVCLLMVVVYAASPQGVDVARRLSRVLNPPTVEKKIWSARRNRRPRAFWFRSGN